MARTRGASIAALTAQNETLAAARQTMLQARGEADTALDQLHAWTGEGLTLIRLRLRNDPEKQMTISTLSANGTSRANKLKEAAEWENAWAKIEDGFAPTTENTFAAFQALRKQCVKLVEEYGTAEGDMIRSRIPTTTGGASPLPQTTLTNGAPGTATNGSANRSTNGTPGAVVTPAPVAPAG